MAPKNFFGNLMMELWGNYHFMMETYKELQENDHSIMEFYKGIIGKLPFYDRIVQRNYRKMTIL